MTDSEKQKLNNRNNLFSDYIACEEEITLRMDFNSNVREKWTTSEINKEIFENKSSSILIGKALSKLKIKYPNYVEIYKTNKGRSYTLPIKK